MSPEQVRAEELDARTDIFSFGALLYEMLTGRQPFEGATWGATISAVLTYDPPPLALHVAGVPSFLESVVRRCLGKRREDRYGTTRELQADLERARHYMDSGVATVPDGPALPRARARRFFAPALALLGLLAAGFGVYLATQPDQRMPGDPGMSSIAVLPFQNGGATPETEYLSDGVTDSLINSLSQVPRLRVIGRGSVFRYKDQAAADPQQVGRTLSVDAVLTGRVLQQGDTLVVRVELTRVADGTHLWGEQYTRKFQDIFAVQDQISGAIAERLKLELSGDEQRRVRKRYTDDADAYTLYLKGRYFWNRRTVGDLKKSIEYYDQALALDPDYALAYAGLADTYTVLGSGGYDGMVPAEARQQAEAAALRALAIDDSLAEAHTSLAVVKLNFTWDWAGAEQEFKRAIELNPSYATAHYYYSRYLNLFGRNEESIAESRRAEAIEPLVPTLSVNVARAYSFARQHERVIEQCRRALELDPDSWQAYWFLGLGHLHLRRYDEALAAFQKVRALTDDSPTSAAGLGFTYALAGEREKARAVLRDLEDRSKRQYISPENFALVYACLGDNDRAFYWLEKAYQDHSTTLPNLQADPLFDGLRSDPRYEDLVRRLGLSA
jgi:TolB-like protein/Flp pilus assembly protein TadD